VIELRPIRGDDAELLYPLLVGSDVPDTLLWDGPASLDEYRASLTNFAAAMAAGERHHFAIVDGARPIGCIGIIPEDDYRGELGLWIGRDFHGRGVGTAAVRLAARHAFEALRLAKLEAGVFVGNLPSRRIFEKSGFLLEGTIRRAVRKRGRFVDEWLFGLLPEELVSA
jgi:RimJ/RimL family protein N-acetyltransferase